MKISGKKIKNQVNENLEIESKNTKENESATRGNLFFNLAHDLKNPIQALTSLTGILLKELQPKNGPIKGLIHNIDTSSQKIKGLVFNLLEWVKSQLHSIQPHPEHVSIHEVLNGVLQLYFSQISQKSVKINIEVDKSHVAYADANMIEVVIKNIVSQSIKLSPIGGQIFIKSYLNSNDESVIHFYDCGMHDGKMYQLLAQEIQKEEFEIKSDAEADLGLLIAKEFVKVNNGRIEWKTIHEQGSALNIIFPAGKIKRGFTLKKQSKNREESKLQINQLQGESILLLNLDARSASSIKKMFPYSVVKNETIESGDIGYTFESLQPSLIITGLLNLDDTSLAYCKMLKSLRSVSHIPFIFINEDDSDELYLEGLKAGADACVVKPFDELLFLTKTKNLFDSIERSKLRFSVDAEMISGDGPSNGTEDGLLQKVAKFVEENIANPDLCGNLICKEIGISKSLLYLRLKDLTGQTVNEFIRIFRLKVSTKLLMEGKLNISQIASEIGFNSPSYFTRSFAKFYGMPPKEYVFKQLEYSK